jgi:hypothetical protein
LFANASAVFTDYLTLVCWSWTSGFLLGSLARRTIPVHGALFCLAVLFAGVWGVPRNSGDGGSNAVVFSLAFYRVVFPVLLQIALVLIPSVWGMRQGLGMATFPRPLRAMLWAGAVVSAVALVIMNFGWVLCSAGWVQGCMEWAIQVGYAHVFGRSPFIQISTLPLALAGPVGYGIAAAAWRRWRGMASAA